MPPTVSAFESSPACTRELSSQHASAHVSIRQHTSAHVSTLQHTSAYVSIRQHTSAHVFKVCTYRFTIYLLRARTGEVLLHYIENRHLGRCFAAAVAKPLAANAHATQASSPSAGRGLVTAALRAVIGRLRFDSAHTSAALVFKALFRL